MLEVLESRDLLSAGVPDVTFGTGGRLLTDFGPTGMSEQAVFAIPQPDGKFIVLGNVYPVNPVPNQFADGVKLGLVRYNPNGTLDTQFGMGGRVLGPLAAAVAGALQPDGMIVILGQVLIGSNVTLTIARFTSTGQPDTSFGTGGQITTPSDDFARGLVIQPDGKIVVATAGGNDFSAGKFELLRFDAGGHVDTSFGASGKAIATGGYPTGGVALQSDGKIVMGGQTDPAGPSGQSIALVVRFNPDGSRDTSFAGIVDTLRVGDLALRSDGKIVIATAGSLARLNTDGSVDTSFGTGGKATVVFQPISLTLQMDNKIVVDGTALTASGTHDDPVLARYNQDGSLDTAFGTNGVSRARFGIGSVPFDLTLTSDGRIVAVGETLTTSRYSPGSDFAIAMFTGDTTPPVSGSSNQQFVEHVYRDALGRAADPGGLAFWTGQLDQGRLNPSGLVLAIEQSHEYHIREVEELYFVYLRRFPDVAGRDGWVSFLDTGATVEKARTAFLASDEYFTRIGNGSAQGYVRALYVDVLHRVADFDGQSVWVNALANGQSRASVATAFVSSLESDTLEVITLYGRILARFLDIPGLNSFVNVLQHGGTNEMVIAGMMGSAEYFNNQG